MAISNTLVFDPPEVKKSFYPVSRYTQFCENHYNSRTVLLIAMIYQKVIWMYSQIKKTLNYCFHFATNSVDCNKKIDFISFKKLVRNCESKSVESALISNGNSTTIDSINFTEKSINFSNRDLNGITFIDCTLDWILFENATIKNCNFINCNMEGIYLAKACLTGVNFENCTIEEGSFNYCVLKNVTFKDCSLNICSFESAKFSSSRICDSRLYGSQFLQAEIKDTKIQACDLENTVFFGCDEKFEIDSFSSKTKKMTLPVTVLVRPTKNRGHSIPRVYSKLIEKDNLVPIIVSAYDESLNAEVLLEEIQNSIEEYDCQETKVSRPKFHLQRANNNSKLKESNKVLEKVKNLMGSVDGILLPGGENIPSIWYEKDEGIKTNGESLKRSFLEFALIDYAKKEGIPLMGICRGHQAICVYNGAKLEPVSGQFSRLQDVNFHQKTDVGLLPGFFRDTPSFRMSSAHYQGVLAPEKGEEINGMETLYDHMGIIKVSENQVGSAPVISLQVHPEFYLQYPFAEDNSIQILVNTVVNLMQSSSNNKFWELWCSVTSSFMSKRKVINELNTLFDSSPYP